MIRDYLIGEREPPNDLMSWNADATRMPYRMHSNYLRKLFLNNDLAEGHYRAGGKPIALSDIHTSVFAVGTLRDHVAPWKSTYKIHFLADAEITYVLTGGGHNAGILAAPDEDAHSYQMLTKAESDSYLGPEEWQRRAPHHEGSWWTAWVEFLAARSGEAAAPPVMGGLQQKGASLDDAPGTYVLQR
jgi:polyhydroxyalkanoate synthase